MKTWTENGYIRITLIINKKKQNFYIHRLLAETFIKNPKPTEYFEVDHIDKQRNNNNIKNLRWVNRSINNFNKVKK